MHDNDGDKPGMRTNDEGASDPLGLHDASRWGEALKLALAGVSALALLLAMPDLLNATFPVTGLVAYALGMGFVAMPLCLYHEYLLRQPGAPRGAAKAALRPGLL